MKVEQDFEKLLSSEAEEWTNRRATTQVSLDSLRTQARALSREEKDKIATEVSGMFPVKVSAPKTRSKAGWRQLAAGLLIAGMLLSFAPAMARNSLDLPGIGVLVQKFTMRHVGLDWAFENGYMQGTLAQASKNGVTVKILGYLADPVHTTVIYVIQGVDQATIDANSVPVTIQSIQGEGAFSWGGQVVPTSVGYVGTVHTWAIEDAEAILNLKIGLPGDDSMNIVLPISREAISTLAEVREIGLEQTIAGITLRVDTLTLTPSQLMVEYSIRGQGGMAGGMWNQDPLLLRGPDMYMEHRSGSGGSYNYETDEWQLRAIFDRPRSLSDLEFVVPNQPRHITVDFEWPLDREIAMAESGELGLEIYDISADAESVFFRYDYRPDLQNLRSFELVYADGSTELIEHPTISWRYLEWTGVTLRAKGHAAPIAVRAHAASVLVQGPWTIPLTSD